MKTVVGCPSIGRWCLLEWGRWWCCCSRQRCCSMFEGSGAEKTELLKRLTLESDEDETIRMMIVGMVCNPNHLPIGQSFEKINYIGSEDVGEVKFDLRSFKRAFEELSRDQFWSGWFPREWERSKFLINGRKWKKVCGTRIAMETFGKEANLIEIVKDKVFVKSN